MYFLPFLDFIFPPSRDVISSSSPEVSSFVAALHRLWLLLVYLVCFALVCHVIGVVFTVFLVQRLGANKLEFYAAKSTFTANATRERFLLSLSSKVNNRTVRKNRTRRMDYQPCSGHSTLSRTANARAAACSSHSDCDVQFSETKV